MSYFSNLKKKILYPIFIRFKIKRQLEINHKPQGIVFSDFIPSITF